MDKTGQVNRVDFSAFCKAFESIEEKSGKSICSALDISSTVASTDFIYREADGDGDIRVPEYGFVKGKGQVVASRWLSQNGHVQRDAEGGSSFVARTDSELVKSDYCWKLLKASASLPA